MEEGMTRAQTEAYCCGIAPEENDPQFVAQHLSACHFARRFAKGKRVLEVGFGEGYGASYLAEIAREVIGIDLAPGNIARASAKYRRANLYFQQMDATRLSFPEESFDVVCSFQVIEHIPEPQLLAYLAELARVLRSDGLACLSTLNLAHNMKPGRPYEKLVYHEKEFTAPELAQLLQQVFPKTQLYGLHRTMRHEAYQRLKKWGLERFGPRRLNPVARFYERVSVRDFAVSKDVSQAALDLIAVCRK
jgi:ubiquinone/menaquinone biosynthesis C-methylase UbiE